MPCSILCLLHFGLCAHSIILLQGVGVGSSRAASGGGGGGGGRGFRAYKELGRGGRGSCKILHFGVILVMYITLIALLARYEDMHSQLVPYFLTVGSYAYDHGTSALHPLAKHESWIDKVKSCMFVCVWRYSRQKMHII